jgi:uncharacterized protein YndB with AHSA1/START domain
VAAPVITYRRGFRFDAPPDRLWERIEQVDRFEQWWPWLSDFQLEGDGLSAGSVLRGVVHPPIPYWMHLEIELVEARRPWAIDAVVAGDLVGPASLRLRPDGEATWAQVAWTLEMQQPAMRLASRFGRPLLQWGHDRVVESTVTGFRRRLSTP